MSNTLSSTISPYGVVRLLICNEIELTDNWSFAQSKSVFDTLLSMGIDELLVIVDSVERKPIVVADIPQFGSISNLIRVPIILAEAGCANMNYAELGFRLKNDPNAKLYANIKFGENHGKGASLLGLVSCIDQRFSLSPLSNYFCQISDTSIQEEIVKRLFFRIPLVQAILMAARDGIINGYQLMSGLSASTQKRRGQCLRAVFRYLRDYKQTELNRRLDNIVWEC